MASNPETPPKNKALTMSATQQFEAQLLSVLEISSYELAVLEKHFLSNGYVPDTTDEAAIKDAVFDFRESFFAFNPYNNPLFSSRAARLNTLFDAYPDDEEYFDYTTTKASTSPLGARSSARVPSTMLCTP
jgi:hypothetical protein